jgi:hypothetical protein
MGGEETSANRRIMTASPFEATIVPFDEPDDTRRAAVLRGPRLVAEVGPAPAEDTPDGLPRDVDDDLRRAVANAGMTPLLTSVVTPAPDSQGYATLDVVPHDDRRAVLLVQDEAGVVSWHRPHAPAEDDEDANPPAPGERVEFRIPAHRLAPATTAAPSGTTLAGPAVAAATTAEGGTKVLQVLEFPVGATSGGAASLYAEWEQRARPAVVRWFPPCGGLPRGEVLTDAVWRSLDRQPTLLFVHGIFSSCTSGFAGLLRSHCAALDELWAGLRANYDGRILGYDHPTASVSPEENVDTFLAMIPDGVHLTVDLVCHSRGGLVARLLAEASRRGDSRITIRKIVFAGTPNGGTAIAVPENWGALVDRWTNLLRFLPPGPWGTSTPFGEILELVKVLAERGEAELPGLAVMRPGSPLYAELDAVPADPPTYYAIQADYEPHGALKGLFDLGHDLGEVVDPLVDRVFRDAPNDVAVPTLGVGDPSGVESAHPDVAGFPVPDGRRLDFGADDEVWHCSYFDHPLTWEHLRQWLP